MTLKKVHCQKYPLLFLPYAAENQKEKQGHYKKNVINMYNKLCSRTSAEAQDLNESLALSQITPPSSALMCKFVNRLEKGDKNAVV